MLSVNHAHSVSCLLYTSIYLNHYENTYLLSDVNKLHTQIIFYARYVVNTFIVFNGTIRQIDNLRQYLNDINKHIQFTSETENNSRLNFLDLTVIKANNGFKYQIYRKPTTTDITIHADSHHPNSQKMAAYNSFIHRLVTIPMETIDSVSYTHLDVYKRQILILAICKAQKVWKITWPECYVYLANQTLLT